MKKVIFGAAALLFTGALMAQTVNLPAQSNLTAKDGSNSKDANEVSHLGSNPALFGGNTGEAIQNGNTNKVQVRQAGTNQSAYSVQSDGLGTGDNRARIWQTGAVLSDSGYRNVADVRQQGTGNQASAYQEGDTNEAVVRQGMKDGGLSTGNKAYINHGTGEQGETNYAMVEQDGLNNTSKTVQQYDNSEARTVQEGDDNMADIRQDAGPNQSAGHSALAEQYGNENATRIRQYGSAKNTAHSMQNGDRNKVNQTQTSNAASGIGNNAVVDQGYGLVPFSASASAIWGSTSSVDNIQNGTFNGSSDDAKALQIQDGSENDALIGQFGDGSGIGNVAEQRQDGDRNGAVIGQNAYGSTTGGDKTMRVKIKQEMITWLELVKMDQTI